ncbi:hypothetical protein ACTHQF_13095 [Pedobacter sp. SAFR-022]|uniref:hypothetical protein n=1 Tax=Pedobacter sp. SAFR-022 TaxID=3436861 RepID=UPI003F806BBB
MEKNMTVLDTTVLPLPGREGKQAMLQIITRCTALDQLNSNYHYTVVKANAAPRPCWLNAEELPVQIKPARSDKGVEMVFTLFQVYHGSEPNGVVFQRMEFSCRELPCDADTLFRLQLEPQTNNEILIGIQTAWMDNLNSFKQAHDPVSYVN